LSDIPSFWERAARLKGVERKGWKKLHLRRTESVADHSFAVALISLFEAERRGWDTTRVLILALIHDLEESITGDLTPADKRALGMTRVNRGRDRAIRKLLELLPARRRATYRGLWRDLRIQRSREARLVHQLDKFEMALQASRYSKIVGRKRVADFYASAAKEISDDSLRRELARVVGFPRLGG
jgi:putative hydrolases of HD superfamily